MSIKILDVFKKIIALILVLGIFVNINVYALDQVLTAPAPSFVENKIQKTTTFSMNRFMLGKNLDLGTYPYVAQNFSIDKNSLGGFIFKLQRTDALPVGGTAEKIKVQLYQNGSLLASDTIPGVETSTSPSDIKWTFPTGLSVTPLSKMQLRISVDTTEFIGATVTSSGTNSFPYYAIGFDNFQGSKPMGFGTMEYYDGDDTVVTSDLLNLTIIRADLNNIGISIPSKYKFPTLKAKTENLGFLNNVTDMRVVTNTTKATIGTQCTALTASFNGNVYRPLNELEAEKMLKGSNLFYSTGGILDIVRNMGSPAIFGTNGAELITPTKTYLFSKFIISKYYESSNLNPTLSPANGFGVCVYDETQNIVGLDQKSIKINYKDIMSATNLNVNTERYLTNKTQTKKAYRYNSKIGSVNVKTQTVYGNIMDTGYSVQAGSVIKVFGNAKIDTSGYRSPNGYIKTDGTRVGNFAYKIGVGGKWISGSEYNIIEQAGNLYIAINEDNNDHTDNDGYLTATVEPIMVTNSIRENNNLYVNIRKNVDKMKLHIGTTTDGTNYSSIYDSPNYVEIPKIHVNSLDFIGEKNLNAIVNNATALASDGTYSYALKGNKIFMVSSNFTNDTTSLINQTYTLTKDLSNVKSLISYKGTLYAGYSNVGLCDTISKIQLNSDLSATVTDIKLEECIFDAGLGDIKNKKVEKTNYLLSTDGKYVYSISYLLGNQTTGNTSTEDRGYRIRVYDPEVDFSMLKDVMVPTIRKLQGSVGEISTKVGYYTEGFIADENYLYIIQRISSGTDAKVIVIDKSNFKYLNDFNIKQSFTDCQNDSTNSITYTCPITGSWDYMTDTFLMLSANATKAKVSYYKANKDALANLIIPNAISLDYQDKLQKYLINYDYIYSDYIKTSISVTPASGEKINNSAAVVSKGYEMSNKDITVLVGDVTNVVATNQNFKEGNGGIYNIYRNEGNSKSIRKDSVGLNNWKLEIGTSSGLKSIHQFRGDYGTVSRVKKGEYTILGEKDENGIVPGFHYYYYNDTDDFIVGEMILRNDGAKTYTYSSNIQIGETGFDLINDSRNSGTFGIGNNEPKWIKLVQGSTDDDLLIGIPQNANQTLGYDAGTNTLKVNFNNITLNAGETKTYKFFIGSYVDGSNPADLYTTMTTTSDGVVPFADTTVVAPDLSSLNLSVTRGEKNIPKGIGAGANNNYSTASNNTNVTAAFAEPFEGRVDANRLPLAANGWNSIDWKLETSGTYSGMLCTTPIMGTSGNGKIATLELVKYLPDDTTISFDFKGKSDGANDTFNFYVDETKKIANFFNTTGFNIPQNITVSKGLHIFTWKYGKDINTTGAGDDKICIDNVSLPKTLEVFGNSCGFAGASLFYTNRFENSFENWKTEFTNGTYNNIPKTGSEYCIDNDGGNHCNGSNTSGTFSTAQLIKIYAHGTSAYTSKSDRNNKDIIESQNTNFRGGWSLTNNAPVNFRYSVCENSHWGNHRGELGWYYCGFEEYVPDVNWYIEAYAQGQVGAVNIFNQNGYRNLAWNIPAPGKAISQKVFFDFTYASYTSDDLLEIYLNSAKIRRYNGGSSTDTITDHTGNGETISSNKWYTIPVNTPSTDTSNNITYSYVEYDGGDDGATYIDNLLVKVKDVKDGCNMEPKAYNDKVGTNFLVPGFKMQVDNNTGLSYGSYTDGKIKVLPLEPDTIIRVSAYNAAGALQGTAKEYYSEKVGQTIDFSVKDTLTYKITSNKVVSVLMNNFYEDMGKSGSANGDDSPTYDSQNGSDFIVYMPGNKDKKGNLYIAGFDKSEDITVKIEDLTNNKTNYLFDLTSDGSNNTLPADEFDIVNATDFGGVMSAGGYHTMFLMNNGTVKSVGYNYYGQLGDGTTTNKASPVTVPGLTNVKAISAGFGHTVFLMNDGTVKATGYNISGELGDGTTTNKASPVTVPGLTNVKAISVGYHHTMFLMNDGTVKATGYNISGQLGDGTMTNKASPVTVPGLTNVKAISAGFAHTIFLMNDGTVKATGYNAQGQLGDGTTTDKASPVTVPGLTNVKAISAGFEHTMFLMNDGTVKSVGRNDYGQLGDGTNTNRNTPVNVAGLTNVKAISAGFGHTMFLMNDGTVKATGYNISGELGDGTNTNRYTPVNVVGIVAGDISLTIQVPKIPSSVETMTGATGTGIVNPDDITITKNKAIAIDVLANDLPVSFGEDVIAISDNNSYYITNDGNVYGVGQIGQGQLGSVIGGDKNTPILLNGITGISQISSGHKNIFFLMNDGSVKGMGNNLIGQLGDGTTSSKSTPITISGLNNVKQISAGQNYTIFLMNDGTVKATGYNDYGQLGDGTTSSKSTPITISGLNNVKQISAGVLSHAMYLMNDGTVKATGRNDYGQLGDGTTTSKSTSITIPGLNNIKQVIAGGFQTFFLMNDGTVKATGRNDYGQLGDGTTTSKSTPITIPGLNNVKQIGAGSNHTLFLMNDGTVKATGYNLYGQLGDGTTINKSTPITIPGLNNVKKVITSTFHSVFLMNDGSVKSVGFNLDGQLGDSTNSQKTIPVITSIVSGKIANSNISIIQSIQSYTNPTKGTVQLIDGKFYYKPGLGFLGTDTFTYTTNAGTTTVTIKVVDVPAVGKALENIGEGQILHITAYKKGSDINTSPKPIIIYYGLGNNPAISEILSPNAQEWKFPIKSTNYSDYKIQLYSYYDANATKVLASDGAPIAADNLDIGQITTKTPLSSADIGKWYKANGTGPIGLAIGNTASSVNYSYPIKSADKIYGIGSNYMFTNTNADKLIIIADENAGTTNITLKNLQNNNTTAISLNSRASQSITISPNTSYQLTSGTTDNTKNYYVYVQKGSNTRNTFATIFKSRNNEQLNDRKVKLSLADKFVKYDVIGDFDYITDSPITVGNLIIKDNAVANSLTSFVGGSTNINSLTLNQNEKVVYNGYAGYSETTRDDYFMDNVENARYANGMYYMSYKQGSTLGGIYTDINGNNLFQYSGGGMKNKTTASIALRPTARDSDFANNGPNLMYKKYGTGTYFPEVSWDDAYKYVKATGNAYSFQFTNNYFYGKRNMSNLWFSNTSWVNSNQSFATSVYIGNAGNATSNFADTYIVPAGRTVGTDTFDFVELNKNTDIKFDKLGSKNGVMCVIIEDNNKKMKDICYTSSDILNGTERNDLTYPAKTVDIGNTLGNFIRNVYTDYVNSFNDGSIPVKITGLEFTGLRLMHGTFSDYTTFFENVDIRNFTDVNTSLTYDVNTNVLSPNTPISHSIKIGTLNLNNGTQLVNTQTATFTNISNNSDNGYNGATGYEMRRILDNDIGNNSNGESKLVGTTLVPVVQKKDYMITFRTIGFNTKRVKVIGNTSGKIYLESSFKPNQFSGNMVGGIDIGDEIKLKFKTGWGENESVKVEFYNDGGDFAVGKVMIYTLDETQFATPTVSEITGSPNSGEIPVMLPENIRGIRKNENLWKIFFYQENTNNNTWMNTATTETTLNTLVSQLKAGTVPNITKMLQFNNDSNIVSISSMNGDQMHNLAGITNGFTNLYSETAKTLSMRIGLSGILKVNGTTVYKNLDIEKIGCKAGTELNAGYAAKGTANAILSTNCIIDIPLNAGNNTIEFISIDYYKTGNSYKGFYKEKNFISTYNINGTTSKELLSFNIMDGIQVPVESFINYDSTTTDHISIGGGSLTLGKSASTYKSESALSIGRDYSSKIIPHILQDRTNETYYDGDKLYILRNGIYDGNSSNCSPTFIKTDNKTLISPITGGNGCLGFNIGSNITLNNSDMIETFIKFKNEVPKTLGLAIMNNNGNWNRMYFGEMTFAGEETEGGKKTKMITSLSDITTDIWYRLLVPASYGNISVSPISKFIFNIKPDNGSAQIEVGDITVLRNYTKNYGNNVKLSFDVEPQNGTTNQFDVSLSPISYNVGRYGYTVSFSKGSNQTCIYKNDTSTPITCVANDESKFNPAVSKYRMSFVKTNDKLNFVVSYDYTDPTDNILKKKVVNLISITDSTPINMSDTRLVFGTTSGIHKISNIKIEDGEDWEPTNILYIKMDAGTYNNYGKVRVTNEDGEISEKLFPVVPGQTEYYVGLETMPSFNKRITDIEVLPNSTMDRLPFNIFEISLIKESETPLIITKQTQAKLLGTTILKKGSKVISSFKNTKAKIMGFTIFVRKAKALTYQEGLTLKFYKALPDGTPDYTNLLAEKTVTTDSIDSVNTKPLKITFPPVAVIKNDKYAIELSTENSDGYFVYGNNKNEYIEGYSYQLKEEHPEQEGWEFNNLGLNVPGTKGANGYLGINALTPTQSPTRYTVTGDNMGVFMGATTKNMVTIPYHQNLDFKTRFTILAKGKWSPGSNYQVIASKDSVSGCCSNRVYGMFVTPTTGKLHFGFSQNGMANQGHFTTGTPYFDGLEHTIAISIDTVSGDIMVYRDGILKDQFELGATSNTNAVKFGGGIFGGYENTEKGRLFKQNSAPMTLGYYQQGGGSSNSADFYTDYIRIYDDSLNISQVQMLSNPTAQYKYRLPHDIGLYVLSKNSDVESLEERTYDLGEGIVREVNGDLYLDGYDAGNGLKELLLKGNITFHVKGNIYINADNVYVVNDSLKEGDPALSYIGFVADGDIIIGANVKHLEGGYFAKGSIKTVPSNLQLKVKGLFAANEVDLQNRTYMGTNFNPNNGSGQEDSVIMEFDNRIYKRMPPLFYQSNDKKGIQIKEE